MSVRSASFRSAYVAGKWTDGPKIREVMAHLAKNGIEITHDWTSYEIIPPGKVLTREEDFARLQDCADHDIDGVRRAEVVVALLTDAKYPYRGTCAEFGAALALGKPVILVIPPECDVLRYNCFMQHRLAKTVESVEAMYKSLGVPVPGE